MFVRCLHSLNYSSVGLSILNSCAKVPGLCLVIGTFFFLSFFLFFFFFFWGGGGISCEIENSYVRKHHRHLICCKSELVKYIIFPVLSSIRTETSLFQDQLTANLYMYI